jgi:serine/threonine-protein kinase
MPHTNSDHEFPTDSLEDTLSSEMLPHPLQVDVVAGSEQGLSQETLRLLKSRLRSAALVMFGGFAAYLALTIFLIDWSDLSFVVLYQIHFLLTLVLGISALLLCRKHQFSARALRLHELVIFGGPTAFFFAFTLRLSRLYAAGFGYLPELVSTWLVLIFVYALFIPNTWQRAALVIGSITALRLGLAAYLHYFDPICSAAQNAGFQSASQNTLIMLVGSSIATIGVFTIGTLRRQAFKAKQLGQYRLGEKLGSGGMGEVYLAEHQLMKRPCAIKIIRPEKAADARALARFEREVRAAAALSHWNSIDIFDYGHDERGTFYYVMEYLPGMNLGDLVKQYGPLPPARVIHLLLQTCDALAEAHAAGLIHRDIKPANIFAAQRGGHQDVAKLLDFGLVKPIAEAVAADLDKTGQFAGSPLYMSPEQAVGDEPDTRSDIYALGAVAYFLLTGQPPFNSRQAIKVLMAHAHESPLPMTKLVPNIPHDLQQVVMRCLAKDPIDRYQSAHDLQAALAACADANHWTDEDAWAWWSERERLAPESTVAAELISSSHI